MILELNRATFRRLVQLNIFAFCTSLASSAAQFFIPDYRAFSDSFDTIVLRHFGESDIPVTWLYVTSFIFFAIISWLAASLVGLLWFKRWARFGFWAASVLLFLLSLTILREPTYSFPVDNLLAFVDGALAGAILILAYASNYGAVWFARPLEISGDH